MNDIKVSVLIPVYGVEKYIECCVRSLFEQTMTENIEFIFTDDCTPDQSIEILHNVLKEYPHRHSQVKIMHHEQNFGLAQARVTGLNAARGEYVIHCDSDDWVAPDIYESMYLKACETGADIVGCDQMRVYGDTYVVKKENFTISHDRIISEMLKGGNIEGFLWNRLIKRSFYLEHAFRADPGITLFEDMAVTIPMHLATCKVAYVNRPLYFYRHNNQQSMSGRLTLKSLQSSIKVLSKLSELPMSPLDKKMLERRMKLQLFGRAHIYYCHDLREWSKYELPIIKQSKFNLTLYEMITLWLVEHHMYRTQYAMMCCRKAISLSVMRKHGKILLNKVGKIFHLRRIY